MGVAPDRPAGGRADPADTMPERAPCSDGGAMDRGAVRVRDQDDAMGGRVRRECRCARAGWRSTRGSVMTASTRNAAPQRGHWRRSMSNTSRRRCIELIGARAARSGVVARAGRELGIAEPSDKAAHDRFAERDAEFFVHPGGQVDQLPADDAVPQPPELTLPIDNLDIVRQSKCLELFVIVINDHHCRSIAAEPFELLDISANVVRSIRTMEQPS